jgi:hypothetical protein
MIAVGLVATWTVGLAAVLDAAGAPWFVEAGVVEFDCAQAAEAANISTKIANVLCIDAPS